jgi:hypothetical protein
MPTSHLVRAVIDNHPFEGSAAMIDVFSFDFDVMMKHVTSVAAAVPRVVDAYKSVKSLFASARKKRISDRSKRAGRRARPRRVARGTVSAARQPEIRTVDDEPMCRFSA